MTRLLCLLALGIHSASALPEGFESKLFAGPPNVSYPAGLCAAPTGEIFVSQDLNSSIDQKPNRGKIIRCVDTDGDGAADQFTDFAPNIDSLRGSCFVGDTLYVVNPPFLSAFRDFDWDGVADERKDLVTGMGFDLSFRSADHTSNGVRMGIDGWLYLAIGDYGMVLANGTDKNTVALRGGGVLRVRPDGTELEIYSRNTRNICDVAVSPYLDVFSRDNTNDGKGWNTRFHHFVSLADMGYPRLYKHFPDEHLKSMADYGGGSGTGALYLHEPGFPDAYNDKVYTCDFTTQHVYVHPMQRHEATFVTQQEKFFAKKAIDMDVDGFSRLYVSDWKDGGYRYSKSEVGGVYQITYPELTAAKFPDLVSATNAELLVYLTSPSAVCRLNAQREMLRRGTSEGLVRVLRDDSIPLYARVAALFTLAQREGRHAHDSLLLLCQDADLREFALRALADRKTQTLGVPSWAFRGGFRLKRPACAIARHHWIGSHWGKESSRSPSSLWPGTHNHEGNTRRLCSRTRCYSSHSHQSHRGSQRSRCLH